jgi:hypothetical protein
MPPVVKRIHAPEAASLHGSANLHLHGLGAARRPRRRVLFRGGSDVQNGRRAGGQSRAPDAQIAFARTGTRLKKDF